MTTRPSDLSVPRARICVVGPLLGSNEGWVVSQGEVLARLLAKEGYEVLTASSIPGRWRRLADILWSVFRWRRRYDVVIVMVFSGPAFWISRIVAPVARSLNKRVVLWLHGGDLPSFLATHHRSRRWLGSAGHYLVAPSPYLLHSLPAATTPARVIPNVLPERLGTFRLRRAVQPNVLWMRTFHPLYRPLLAIETVSELKRRGRDVRVTLAGQDKGMMGGVRSAVAATYVKDQVQFAGFLNMEAKQGFFAANDIFLNTTAVDNFPVSLIEAASTGMVIVSASVGGIPFVFTDGVDALLVDPATPAAFADAIERLLDDPQLAARISDGARRVAERCTWEKVRPEWTSLLSDLSEGTPRG